MKRKTAGSPRIVRNSPLRASAAALVVFALVAAIDEPTALDRALYDWAARHYDRRLERAQWPIELLGLPGAYIPIALALTRHWRRNGRRHTRATIIKAAFGGWLALRLSRLVIHRPRPPRPLHRRPKRESTFPSGHTTGVTALAAAAALVLHDERILTAGKAAALGIGWPIVTAANRVYVREHWLTDVLGGLALGLSASMAVLAVNLTASSAVISFSHCAAQKPFSVRPSSG
ncbi:MAG TPA: phosphatase PAP2 family protein [Casimicrobiaceae bacterium]|nr:phosphatase PAP2 family protein [Casimicrobiaceae bacterium]